MEHVYLVFLFLVGISLGSFYNVVIYRFQRGMSLLFPSSHCPVCKHSIKWYDNIPIISYLLLRGRCRYCGTRISLRYPLVELSTGVLALLCTIKWGITLSALVFFIFFSLLLILSIIDWDTFTLPDSLTLGGLAFGILTSLIREDFHILDSLLGAFVGGFSFLLIYLYYVKFRRMEGLGFGDVKLMAFIGSIVGVKGVLYSVFLGSFLGLAYALPIVIRNKSLQFAIPFGPFLSLGCFWGMFLELDRFLVSYLV